MNTRASAAPSPAPERITNVSPRPRPQVEVGVSAYLPFVVPYRNVWEMLRAEEITVRQLTAMRRTDGQARALYRLITLPIRAALRSATFLPAGLVDGGEEEAQFIEAMFTLPANAGGMVVAWQRVIAQMLMAVFNGFSAFEMVYWSPRTGPLKGKWVLKKLAQRPAETLSFLIDEHSEFAGFRQRAMFQGRTVDVLLPAEHTVYYAANEEETPFYGRSFFESAFYHWDKKFKLYVISHIAAQRAAVGTRIGKLPRNPNRDEKVAFQQALADLGVAQCMTVPEDYSVESLKEGPGGFDFLAFINHHNSQMSKSVLAAFFDDQQGSGGDTTLVDFGRQSDALFMMMLETIMAEVEEVINNKIIPRFIDWNFGTARYPVFRFGNLTEEQKAASVDLFKTLAIAGQSLTISPEFVHELEKQVADEFGLEIDWQDVEAREAAEAAAKDATGGAGTPPPGPPVVDPQLLPSGFTLLSQAGDDPQLVELVRGVPTSGDFKHVRTPAGAQAYRAPIGSPITKDRAKAVADQGIKGKNFGAGVVDPHGKSATGHQVLGGGLGAKAQHPGGVADTGATDTPAVPVSVLGNPKAPGVLLLDYGDGTVAVRDPAGRLSPRQRYDLSQFTPLGWAVDPDATRALGPPATAKETPAAPKGSPPTG